MLRRDAEIMVLAAAQEWVDADDAYNKKVATRWESSWEEFDTSAEYARVTDAEVQLRATVKTLRESTTVDV